MSSIDYDKEFAVYNSVNDDDTTEQIDQSIQNLIHESGRLQLNTYQAFVRNLMNPRSDLRSLLLVHMTGTGKTITALATATEYVRQYQPSADKSSVSSIVVLGFTQDIFKKELLSHPEFLFVNIDEAENLKQLEKHMHNYSHVAEEYHTKRNQMSRRITKREVKGIYQFYGYRQFANRVINMDDVKMMIQKQNNKTDIINDDIIDYDPLVIKKWIDAGKVRIHTDFINTLSHSLFICDEIHNLYRTEQLNTYGMAIQIVFEYFFKTLPSNDIMFGSIRSLLLSATPLTASASEIIPINALLTGEEIEYSHLFKTVDGVDQLTATGASKIRKSISGKISYIMDDNPKEYPTSLFEGDTIAGINYVKFIRTTPIDHQLNSFKNWDFRTAQTNERGSNMIKDITFPATKTYPYGVIFGKNIADLSDLPSDIAVNRSRNGLYSSNIFKMGKLGKYSCKYEKLVSMCIAMKSIDYGKIFIYHPSVQGSGTDLIISILQSNGFVLDGDYPIKDSICMHCDAKYGSHNPSDRHDFSAVYLTFINGSLSKPTISSRLNAFNNELNISGEKIKIIVGSRAMRESHTLKNCRHVIIAHEPSSISEMIQIIGRAVRKHSHTALPPNKRNVKIHILTTNISNVKHTRDDVAANEELAYKSKMLQYIQINQIERIMYDVSIDYLINFRFKLRETPPLLGEPYPLDMKSFNTYQKAMTKIYSDLQNGYTPIGIHTNRFNIFYFESECRAVIIIIKRIILYHQPVIRIDQLKTLIRSPPFYVEYNTKLISDESIAVAINKLVFRQDQLRLISPIEKSSMIDSLFDQSSSLIDTQGREYKIICIGDPLCLDSYLVKRMVSSIIEGDRSVLDSFHNAYSAQLDGPIDLEEIANLLATSTSIEEVIEDLKASLNKTVSSIDQTMKKIPIVIHAQLAEWSIENAIGMCLRRTKISPSDLDLSKYLIEYYQSRRLVFIVADLKNTRIYDRFKTYNINNGASWYNKSTTPSTFTMPIGHAIGDTIHIYQPADQVWMELNSVGKGIESKHTYGFYIYEERIAGKLSVAVKIRYEDDLKAKGITMSFLQTTQLEDIANKLKINISKCKQKVEIIQKIEAEAWKIQSNIYPKRLIYRLIEI